MIRRHFHTSFFTINKSRSQPRGTRLLAVVVIAVSGLLVGVVCQFISNHAKFSFGGVLTDPKKPISCCFMDNDIHGSGLVGKRVIHFSLRRMITKSFFFFNYKVFKRILPFREEKFEICTDERHRMPDIFHGYFNLKCCLFCSRGEGTMTETLKTEGWNERVIASRFNIYNFYPRSLGPFKLLACGLSLSLHFMPHFHSGEGVCDECDKSKNIYKKYPPLRSTTLYYYPERRWGYILAIVALIIGVILCVVGIDGLHSWIVRL